MFPAQFIVRYSVLLRPMEEDHVEMVREWRNAPHVRSKMDFQEYITPEMQSEWWAGLDPLRQHYFIIVYLGKEIGVIHAKEIDWVARTAETGIFIGKPAYLDSFVPVLAVLGLMDALFQVYGLMTLQAKVRADEPKIIDFNRRLGYTTLREENGFLHMQVRRWEYEPATAELRKKAHKLTGN